MQKIQTIVIAVKRMAWDEIPDNIISRYEIELSRLKKHTDNEFKFKQLSIQLYNSIFGEYGYTKPEL